MAFLNANNSILIDSRANIYNFNLIKSGIELIIHEKTSGETREPIIINEIILEYDVCINESDEIDLICKKNDKSLSIYSLDNDKWIESKISKEVDYDICGLKIISLDKTRHIFYYMKSLEDSKRLDIYHHYMEDDSWSTNIIKDIHRSEIIKPVEVIKSGDSLIVGYYDLGTYSEDIFISRFNLKDKSWKDSKNVTNDKNIKLYLDILEIEDYIHITYSEYYNENLTIKHKKIKSDFSEIEDLSENILSNESNCTYPTLIYTPNTLWNVWTEYENIASSYSKDYGDTWSNPYVWNESKKADFTRCKFSTTEAQLKESYVMNYSFIRTYPELTFLGFGNLDEAVESVKKKEELGDMVDDRPRVLEDMDLNREYELETKKHVSQSNYKEDELEVRLDKLEIEIDNIKEFLKNMHVKRENIDISKVNKRISEIENVINRRRNPFSSRTQQKKDS